MAGQLIGAAVQLTVGKRLIFEDDGNGVRIPFNLSFKALVKALILRIVSLGVIPLCQELLALSGCE